MKRNLSKKYDAVLFCLFFHFSFAFIKLFMYLIFCLFNIHHSWHIEKWYTLSQTSSYYMNLMLSYFKCTFQYSIHTCMIRDLNDSHLYSKRLLNISADDLLLDCVRCFVKIFAHFRTSFLNKIGGNLFIICQILEAL